MSGQYKGETGVIISIKDNSVQLSTEQNRVITVSTADIYKQRTAQGHDSQTNALVNPLPVQESTATDGQFRDSRSGGITRSDLIRFGTVETDVGCVLAITNVRGGGNRPTPRRTSTRCSTPPTTCATSTT